MRSPFRTIVVLAVAAVLLALFLRNVDFWRVMGEIGRARPEWLVLSLATMFLNLAIRAYRWQYLLVRWVKSALAARFARRPSDSRRAPCCPRARARSFAHISWPVTST